MQCTISRNQASVQEDAHGAKGRCLADVRGRMHEMASTIAIFQHIWLRCAPVSARRFYQVDASNATLCCHGLHFPSQKASSEQF
jgi:hypothetical protein